MSPRSPVNKQGVQVLDELCPGGPQRDGPGAGVAVSVAAGRRAFAGKLASRLSQMIPAENPDYGDLVQAFPAWTGSSKDPILQPPKPQIRPSARVLERVADRDADIEAGE